MKRLHSLLRGFMMVVFSLTVSSCGGGGAGAVISAITGGGVGTGGTGFVTLIGFGSLITDGDSTHYSSATGTYYSGTSTSASTQTSSTVLGIGQQVEITLDTNGNPTKVQSAPSLIGAVSAITQNSGNTTSFVVNNLTVNINTQFSQGPVTYFVGYTGANAITVNDQVEVHGFYAQDGSGNPYIQATRVVLLPSTNTVTNTVGVIPVGYTSGSIVLPGSAAQSETISLAATPTITPSGTSLAAGQFVSVWSSALPTSNTITANSIRVRQIFSALGSIKVTGLVYAKSGTSFSVSGISVDGSATSLASTVSGLANGTYVVITGTANSSGVLVASTITTSNSGNVEVKGTITNFVSLSSFQVRGTLINATSATLSPNNVTLANGVYVDVIGTVSGNTILASTIGSITTTPPTNSATVEYIGNITAVNSSSFTMTTQSGALLTFALASNVGYQNGTSSSLVSGARVEVEATLSGSTYTAYGVQFLQASSSNNQSGTSEVSGVVSYVQTTGSGYSFEVNNVQITGTGSLPTGFVPGANVDVRFNSSSATSGSVSSGSTPRVDD